MLSKIVSKKRKVKLLVATVGLSLFLVWAAPAHADLATDLIDELMCPSDCAESLAICAMQEAADMREQIKTWVAAGWNRDKIVNSLVDTYGERILAAPQKKGFNLTAWVTPFAAILAGGGFIGLSTVAWVRARRMKDAEETQAVTQLLSSQEKAGYEKQLLEELEKFE